MRKIAAVVVATGMLAACGGATGDDGKAGSGGPGGSLPSAQKSLVKAPEGFDTSKGWQQAVSWVSEDAESMPVGAAPEAGVVAFLQKRGEDYVVEARDAATGAPRWSSKAWRPPVLPDNVAPDEAYLPRLLVVNEGDREYVAVWAYTPHFTDKDTVSLVLYPADSSGEGIAPAHARSLPIDAYGPAKVVDGGSGLLVSWEDKGTSYAAAVDPTKDHVQTYDESLELPVCQEEVACIGGSVDGLSPDGPVIGLDPGGFGVPGIWQSFDAVPPGASATKSGRWGNGVVRHILDDHVLSEWEADRDPARPEETTVAAAHDLKTGKLKASVRCDTEDGDGVSFQPMVSPNGRYAVAGTVAMDLEQGKAYCLQDNGEQESVRLMSVGDDGIAYGLQRASSQRVPVAVTLGTGKVEPLPKGTHIPSLSLPRAAGFSLPSPDGNGLLFTFHPRR
ncbi:hypothetical protein [Streptomyces sp. NPDC004783]|uniref:hypothetical protein n=1 Tax=Streptomyces sp. NPDC004783 TaxID=3154459 RepID=UPI0033AA0B39